MPDKNRPGNAMRRSGVFLRRELWDAGRVSERESKPVVTKPEIPGWLADVAVIPGTFPMEKMREVWSRGDEVEGVLVDYLRWLAGPDLPGYDLPDHDWLHFIAFYLLSDRGCPGLFDPLVAITREEDYADLLLGDSVTEDLPGWFRASGRDRADDLRKLVEDLEAFEWQRVAALTALGGLAWEGTIPREEHHAFIKALPGKLVGEADAVWMEWTSQVAYFGCEDALESMAEAEAKGWVDPREGVAWVRKQMKDPLREEQAERNLFYTRPGGTAGLEEFSRFVCFEPGYYDKAEKEAATGYGFDGSYDISDYGASVVQVVREGPKVGRNDPCPCGSGKKWKKCCGAS